MVSMPKFQGLNFAERAKICSDSWSKLSDQQKQQYIQMAEEDKQRYQKEMKQVAKKGYFTDKNGVDSRTMKAPKAKKGKEDEDMEEEEAPKPAASVAKKVDDRVKPKKPLSSWMLFNQEQYEPTRKKNPDLSMVEITKANSEKWRAMTEKQKEKYDKIKEKDQARYDKEMK